MSRNKSSDKLIKPTNGDIILHVLIKNWLSFVCLRFSKATYKTYRTAIQEFLFTLPLKVKSDDVVPIDIEKFVQNIIESGNTPKTANTYLAAIKSFYRWAEVYYDIPNQAAPIALLRENPKHLRILSDKEYSAILSATNTNTQHEAIQFLGNTGLRINEFRSLRCSNFSPDYIHIIGKGNKQRSVPLNNICKKIIAPYHFNNTPPFIQCFQKRTATYRLCAKISERANIEYFTPHALRHYFATRLIRAGIPLSIVSKLLGHASSQFTEQVYVHLVPADLRVTDVLEF